MSTPKKLALAAFSFAVTFLVPILAFAQEEKAGANVFDVRGYAAVGAGIAIGLGALGGALGQGRAAAQSPEIPALILGSVPNKRHVIPLLQF